jgi:GT2 family glycosyltransferase
MMKEVSLITICVDMPEMTRKCFELIKKHTPEVYETIIVCDRPSREMDEWLSAIAKDGAKVITNPEPVGVPTALNQGIRVAEGKYIALVNNDIIVTKGWFEPLMDALKAHPEYGWVASKIIRGSVVMNWGVISSTLFLKEAMDKVGPFDERFSQGIGWEDNDYLLRFWLCEYKPHGVHKSVVYHPPEPVTLKVVHGDTMKEKYQRNQQLFIEKWGPAVMQIDWTSIPYD